MYVVHYMRAWCLRRSEMGLETLEVEVQAIVSHQVGPGI